MFGSSILRWHHWGKSGQGKLVNQSDLLIFYMIYYGKSSSDIGKLSQILTWKWWSSQKRVLHLDHFDSAQYDKQQHTTWIETKVFGTQFKTMRISSASLGETLRETSINTLTICCLTFKFAEKVDSVRTGDASVKGHAFQWVPSFPCRPALNSERLKCDVFWKQKLKRRPPRMRCTLLGWGCGWSMAT